MNLLAESFGVLALVLNFIAYRQPSANGYRLISAIALGCLSVHFFMIEAMAGSIVTGIAFVRNLVALRWQGPWVLWSFVAINIGFLLYEIIAPQGGQAVYWALALAYSSSIIFTVGSIKLNDPALIRRWFLLAESLGLMYSVLVGSVSGTVFNIVNITSILLKLLQDRRAANL
ncbi:YgjV family protein [Pseudidiomarina mangrovi]|uniref:YgjV family protein n=1 Tax=Pseudidiomarina mangrovi TaxID=2487133 RepID=UPI000FCC42B9|nr:YgjV family protein [Pseudidiomarina mangrovi]CAI8158712.1 MAG: Uncharacterised protein [Pseudidiomarina mangrovi]